MTIDAELVNPAAEAGLTTEEFQFMTTAELNTYIQDVIQDPAATNSYNIAVSIWDALGGGALIPDPWRPEYLLWNPWNLDVLPEIC